MITLLADIGATNARFALADRHKILKIEKYHCLSYPNFKDAITHFLSQNPDFSPTEGALAIAGPITGDHVMMTNHPWSFSIQEIQKHFNLRQLRVLNDFTALAHALPFLQTSDLLPLLPHATAQPNGVRALIGPGTGLGVSALIPSPDGKHYTALSSEGGHVTAPARTPLEAEIISCLKRRFDHVSAERLVCGHGLENIYSALAEIQHAPARYTRASDISTAALTGKDDLAIRALDCFCSFLGSLTGNLALTLGARGGIYIAGGILPRMPGYLQSSCFIDSYLDKGRFRAYLKSIPIYLVTHKYPAFLGLMAL